MKIKIILSAFNRPDFLPIQVKCINKFLKNENEIVVIHDSRNNDYTEEFEYICKSLDLQFYHHNSLPGKNPSQYHGDVIQYAYDNIIKTEFAEDLVLILDHDMFLIKELDLISYFGDNDVIGRHQQRGNVEYIWPGLMAFKCLSIKDIDFSFHPGVYFGEILDTGGGTCNILKTEGIRFKNTSCQYPDVYGDVNLLDENVNLGFGFELHLDDTFLHFRNACGWHNDMQVDPRDDAKKKVLEYILGDVL